MGNHVVVKKDVARLQITVHDWYLAMVVKIAKSLSDIECDAHWLAYERNSRLPQ